MKSEVLKSEEFKNKIEDTYTEQSIVSTGRNKNIK